MACYICNSTTQLSKLLYNERDEEYKTLAVNWRERRNLDPKQIERNDRLCMTCARMINGYLGKKRRGEGIEMNVLVGHSRGCPICHEDGNAVRVSLSLRVNVYLETDVFIPPETRMCPAHLDIENETLRLEAKIAMTTRQDMVEMAPKDLSAWFQKLTSRARAKPSINTEQDIADDEFHTVTSLSKPQFLELFALCQNPIRVYGRQRRISKKDLLAFLCKLRQNTSDSFLKVIFGYNSRQSVSLAIVKVRECLHRRFVPLHLGLQAISREDFIRHHVTDFANTLYNPTPERKVAIIYIDGTYVGVPKSQNFRVLRQSYCLHKGYHLLKPIMIVAPDGYILLVQGPYFSDSRNNDAACLNNEFNLDIDGIKEWLQENDIIIVDRGYRDSVALIEQLGYQTEMPALLRRGQKQLTTEEANKSRLVTKTRWIVEAMNGQIKNKFKFFSGTIAAHHVPHLGKFFKIACAINNAFHPRVVMQADAAYANEMLRRSRVPNTLHERVVAERLNSRAAGRWLPMNQAHLPGFPILPLQYLRDLTFGVYQINLSPGYIQDRLQRDQEFEFQVLLFEEGLLRGRLYSRHRNSTKYQLWIQFRETNYHQLERQEPAPLPNEEPIIGYCCECPAGLRTLGTCAHVAAALWFLGFARHEEHVHYPSTRVISSTLDAANRGIPDIIEPNRVNNLPANAPRVEPELEDVGDALDDEELLDV